MHFLDREIRFVRLVFSALGWVHSVIYRSRLVTCDGFQSGLSERCVGAFVAVVTKDSVRRFRLRLASKYIYATECNVKYLLRYFRAQKKLDKHFSFIFCYATLRSFESSEDCDKKKAENIYHKKFSKDKRKAFFARRLSSRSAHVSYKS